MTEAINTRHMKLRNTLKSELRGRGWYLALRCLRFAEQQHTDTRKDGATPEYMHQIEIALFALCLIPFLKHPQETMCVILLHDTPEDCGTDWTIIRSLITGSLPEIFGETASDKEFATRVLYSLEKITKVYRGTKKSYEHYFGDMIADPISSIAKCLDRMHNLSTMLGVFSTFKLDEQIIETEKFILPMLKEAQEVNAEQHEAYEICKCIIKNYIKMIRFTLDNG